MRHLLRTLARPDVQGLGSALGLLQRGALRQLRREHERPEHVAQLLDAELVLERLHARAVHDDAEGLQARRDAAADLLDRAECAIGRRDGEQPGLGHDDDAVGCRPRRACERVERRRTVDEHELVLLLDVRERLLEFPDVADGGVRSVEVDRGRRSDEHVDRARTAAGPARRRDGRADDLLLGRGQHVGDVEVTGDVDVHAGRDIRLWVEVDHERRDTPCEGRRCEAERDRGLPHAPLEGADAQNVHEKPPYLH